MRFYLIRGDRHDKWQTCSCRFRIDSDGAFVIFFDATTDGIGLNDGNCHDVNELRGVAPKVSIDGEGIHLNGCFVNIMGKWHNDGFTLYFQKPS